MGQFLQDGNVGCFMLMFEKKSRASVLPDEITLFFSTARCSNSRNSLRGIHSPSPVHILLKGGATSSFDGIFPDERHSASMEL